MIRVPCRITLTGDEDYARNFIGAAQSQLRILESEMRFQNLKQGVRKVRFSQRTTVEARICFNLKEIIIYCMPIFDEGREFFDEVGFCILAGLVFPSSINGRILRSVNFGKTWKQLDDLDPDHVNQVHLIKLGYLENGICLAGSAYHGFMFRSTDYGQNWTYKDLPVDEPCRYTSGGIHTSKHRLRNIMGKFGTDGGGIENSCDYLPRRRDMLGRDGTAWAHTQEHRFRFNVDRSRTASWHGCCGGRHKFIGIFRKWYLSRWWKIVD
jgi:hypothetical protein